MKIAYIKEYGLSKTARIVLVKSYSLEVILKVDGNTCVRLSNIIHEDDLV